MPRTVFALIYNTHKGFQTKSLIGQLLSFVVLSNCKCRVELTLTCSYVIAVLR